MTPKLWGRTDLAKWRNAASTMRNFFVDYRGGASSRAGMAYVGMCKQSAPNVGGVNLSNSPPRDIPFQFSIYQGYVLEFGDFYMRIKSQGAYVTEPALNIQGITQANPAVLNIIAHGYSVGDWVFISGAQGMTNFNGLTWVVNDVIDVNHITVTDLFGNTVDSTLFGAYIGAGTSARIYTVGSPYAAVDLPYLKFTQSKDVMSLCCINQQTLKDYPTYNLQRFGNTNWQFALVTFAAAIGPPTVLGSSVEGSTTKDTYYAYVITSVSAATEEESVASAFIFTLNNNISINEGSNFLSWQAVPGAGSYNVYVATPSYNVPINAVGVPFGYIGTATGTFFTDTNITPDFTTPPPMHFNPFSALGITGVVPTNGGNGAYTPTNIGYIINTSTGSGFSGTPQVTNGFFSGFAIAAAGENYALTDTITITSGGTGPPVAATGTYTFINSPLNGNTVILNGITWSFYTLFDVPPSPGANYTVIQGTLANVLSSFVAGLNASVTSSIAVASYSVSGSVVTITYKTPGVTGNTYTLASGTYGGVVSGNTLTGGANAAAGGGAGATAALQFGATAGDDPSCVAYYQQRRVYANTINEPDTYFMSKPGAFQNMDSGIPTVDSDAIIGSPWAQQVNGIQFLVPMQTGLIVLTGNSAWLLNGGTNAAITPSDQTAVAESYNGCNATVPPITIDYDILYVQSKGSIVCDLAYNFLLNVFTGSDRTVLSSHLFDNHSILQWTWAREANKLVWAVREDGILLSLTYMKEQDIYGWARHDTNGLFVSVSSITEQHRAASASGVPQAAPLADAVYTIVQRYINGQWVYYAERMDDRIWTDSEGCWCVDAGVAYPQVYFNETINASAATGNGVVFTVATPTFVTGNVGDVIRMGGGIATITTFISSMQVLGNITQTIAQTVPNDPNNTPIPQSGGAWSISIPVSTISGLNHLNGMTVTGLADGNVIPPTVVLNGSITLQQPASAITIGLAFLPQLQTMYLDPPSQSGSVQTKRKSVSSVGVRMVSTRGISIGSNQVDASTQQNNQTVPWTGLYEMKQNIASSSPTNSIPLFTGDYFANIQSGWDPKGQVAIQQNYPLPANISAVVCYLTEGDT